MKRKLTILSLIIAMTSSITIAEAGLHTFEDTKYHWSRDYVSYLFNEGIVQGYPNSNKFGVDDGISREQTSAIISRKIGSPEEVKPHKFKDVGGWSEKSIAHLASLDIVKGANEKGDIFDPSRKMSRAEFAAIISRLVKVTGYGSDQLEEVAFKDVDNHWAKSEILAVAKLGLIKGGTDGKFNPNQNITRGEVCAIIARIDGIVAQVPERPTYKVYQGDVVLGSYLSKDGAISEAKKWGNSEVRYDGGIVWSSIAQRVRKYIIDDQWEYGLSTAEACLWDDAFINSLPDKTISKIYDSYIQSGGDEFNIKTFAEYLTVNAPIQSNWKEMFKKSRLSQNPGEIILGYRQSGDYYNGAAYEVYIEGYPPGVYVSLDARTGWWRG